MTKRKIKRYDDGGDIESTNAGIRGALSNMDDSGANVSGQYSSPESQATSEAPQSFGDAFKAARASGAKTFTFNGKSYTTALKGDTKPAAKPAAKASSDTTPAKPAAKAESSYDRMNRENREQGRDFDSLVGKLKDRITNAASRTEARYKNPATNYKKGGTTASSRADGIAQRGKTRGVMR